jgi:hypothetical protein
MPHKPSLHGLVLSSHLLARVLIVAPKLDVTSKLAFGLPGLSTYSVIFSLIESNAEGE